ncbi:putative hydrolase of the HAD superfamily [Thermosporothrix hazakensis]|jgi:putative hydrolase of the HAD superfamily|uniref:2-haloalkanoic acid dehalogenase n=2 Tax=Thermosporothrix TaxID=768650 RepID=A0A455SV33_9CHLR|nr:HAD-IA family hydrolase [Thermosporothrix hazakensis]PZW25446.1 putative hydrolase of the HAD superfamily [Thermosporothrix hazakensis]BBH90782.1 2-haloalkanoic acid dehalogenase [Thermosporothrix sp. COM3]GCE48832.1 2-haloalkanoic acid dehalogenase [Thermosporothrix hazakensis]
MPIEHPQSIRTIFFDAGFTLLRPTRTTPEICQEVAQQLGLHIHLEQIQGRMREAEGYFLQQQRANRHTWASEQAIQAFWVDYYQNLLRPFVEEDDEERLHQLAFEITQEFDKHTHWEPYSDVLPTLNALKERDYTMGVISDWGISLGPILRELRLIPYFDCVLISATAQYAKPSPMLYQMALERADAIPDYTVHIGDTYVQDVLGARSAGITPILLDRRKQLNEQSVDCLLIHSLFGLLDLLEIPYQSDALTL